ncbi:hypothetical protein MKX01_017810 [Papaver californicum]|nr:hypothetical protein MKX01_017810 [Papaver californicum]
MAVSKTCDQKALDSIEEMTKTTDSVQEKVIAEIYLSRFQLNGATDRETFKSKVPIIKYEDIEPEMLKIILILIILFSISSAGERKLMPTIEEELDRRTLLYSLLMPVMNIYLPGLDKGKGLYFLFVKSETKTPGGLLARPCHTILTQYIYTSPDEAILCSDSFQSMYTQMLCGLYQREQVLRLGSVFASGLVRAIRFLQLHWGQLAHDIATGTLNPKITDPSIRHCLASDNNKLQILKPNLELAEFITNECCDENWEGIITRIWPNTKYPEVIVTGAMAQYIPILDYYSNGLPKACTIFKPLCKPSEATNTIMPNMGYFEFLPHEPSPSSSKYVNPKLVDMADLEIGKEYELVITTCSGLCRYQVGDILRVTGFYNTAPQFQFVRRKNVLLSIDSGGAPGSNTKTIPGHYVIYWELLVLDQDKRVTRCKVDHSIGLLEIRIVKNGTFEELMDYAISRGACVNFTPIMELLDSRVLSTHFSPSCPHWTPER